MKALFAVIVGLTVAAPAVADSSTWSRLDTLKGHTGNVYSVAFSPDGALLASGANDHTVVLWEVATGKRLHTLKGHTEWGTPVAFSPDGTHTGVRSKRSHRSPMGGSDWEKAAHPQRPYE